MTGWPDRRGSFVLRAVAYFGIAASVVVGVPANGSGDTGANASGGVLAFERVTCTYDDPGESCVTSIWSVTVSAARAKRLTRAPVWNGEDPAWSPGGERIAFVGNLSDIWTTKPDRSGQKRLAAGRGSKVSPTWSPDGSRIAFGSEVGLFVVDARGGRVRALAREWAPSGISDVSWSPDGRRVVFSSLQGGIYVVRADGRGLRWIARGNLARRPWSPDGRRILFSLPGPGALYAVNADGTGRKLLTENGAQADWSPDGRRIAFVRSAYGPGATIVVMNADGTFQRRLADGMEPQWSPDGRRIAFSDGEGSVGAIHVMNADGTRQRTLVVDGQSPVWQPLRTTRRG